MAKKHVNEQLHTCFANTGRIAGCGMNYDRYDDESGNPSYEKACGIIRFPCKPDIFEATYEEEETV